MVQGPSHSSSSDFFDRSSKSSTLDNGSGIGAKKCAGCTGGCKNCVFAQIAEGSAESEDPNIAAMVAELARLSEELENDFDVGSFDVVEEGKGDKKGDKNSQQGDKEEEQGSSTTKEAYKVDNQQQNSEQTYKYKQTFGPELTPDKLNSTDLNSKKSQSTFETPSPQKQNGAEADERRSTSRSVETPRNVDVSREEKSPTTRESKEQEKRAEPSKQEVKAEPPQPQSSPKIETITVVEVKPQPQLHRASENAAREELAKLIQGSKSAEQTALKEMEKKDLSRKDPTPEKQAERAPEIKPREDISRAPQSASITENSAAANVRKTAEYAVQKEERSQPQDKASVEKAAPRHEVKNETRIIEKVEPLFRAESAPPLQRSALRTQESSGISNQSEVSRSLMRNQTSEVERARSSTSTARVHQPAARNVQSVLVRALQRNAGGGGGGGGSARVTEGRKQDNVQKNITASRTRERSARETMQVDRVNTQQLKTGRAASNNQSLNGGVGSAQRMPRHRSLQERLADLKAKLSERVLRSATKSAKETTLELKERKSTAKSALEAKEQKKVQREIQPERKTEREKKPSADRGREPQREVKKEMVLKKEAKIRPSTHTKLSTSQQIVERLSELSRSILFEIAKIQDVSLKARLTKELLQRFGEETRLDNAERIQSLSDLQKMVKALSKFSSADPRVQRLLSKLSQMEARTGGSAGPQIEQSTGKSKGAGNAVSSKAQQGLAKVSPKNSLDLFLSKVDDKKPQEEAIV